MGEQDRSVYTLTNGLQFDGVNQYAQSASAAASAVTDNFTMMCLVKVLAIPGAYGFFMHNGAKDARGMSMFISTDGTIRADYAFVAELNSNFVARVGIWYMVCLQRSGGTSQLYINAVPQGGTIANAPNSGNDYITLGAYSNSDASVGGYLKCVVDEARFYERVITLQEQQQFYNRLFDPSTPDISSTSLKYWHKLDETSGNPTDSSGNGKTLTAVNTPLFVPGKFPSAIATPSSIRIPRTRPRAFAPGIAR